VCLRLSLSFSPYCLCLSVYPLRHHLTQQCRVVVSCHPAVRQRSSWTEGKDRSGREYTLRLPRPVVRRSTVGWRKWTRGHREGEGSDIPDGTHVLLTPIVESLRWTSDLLKYSNARIWWICFDSISKKQAFMSVKFIAIIENKSVIIELVH